MDTKDLERLDYKSGETNPQNNSPNENIFVLTEIRGLLSQITEKLRKIHLETDKQVTYQRMAISEVDLFERTTLYELQQALAL